MVVSGGEPFAPDSGDLVEEGEPQSARLDHVAALEWRLGDHCAVHAHSMPGGEISYLVAGAIAEHEDVMLGTGGDEQGGKPPAAGPARGAPPARPLRTW